MCSLCESRHEHLVLLVGTVLRAFVSCYGILFILCKNMKNCNREELGNRGESALFHPHDADQLNLGCFGLYNIFCRVIVSENCLCLTLAEGLYKCK